MPTFLLRLACPDRRGVVATMAQGLVDLEANILQNAEFSDPASDTFCMRTRFEANRFDAREIEASLADRAASTSSTSRSPRTPGPRPRPACSS